MLGLVERQVFFNDDVFMEDLLIQSYYFRYTSVVCAVSLIIEAVMLV